MKQLLFFLLNSTNMSQKNSKLELNHTLSDSHLSSVRSCTSSTMTCVTPLRSASPSSLLSRTPVVQYSSLVADD